MAGRGRPAGSENKDKPLRDALRMVLVKDDFKLLRRIAERLAVEAASGDISAIKECFDRIDGKVATPHAGADGEGPMQTVFTIVSGVPREERDTQAEHGERLAARERQND